LDALLLPSSSGTLPSFSIPSLPRSRHLCYLRFAIILLSSPPCRTLSPKPLFTTRCLFRPDLSSCPQALNVVWFQLASPGPTHTPSTRIFRHRLLFSSSSDLFDLFRPSVELLCRVFWLSFCLSLTSGPRYHDAFFFVPLLAPPSLPEFPLLLPIVAFSYFFTFLSSTPVSTSFFAPSWKVFLSLSEDPSRSARVPPLHPFSSPVQLLHSSPTPMDPLDPLHRLWAADPPSLTWPGRVPRHSGAIQASKPSFPSFLFVFFPIPMPHMSAPTLLLQYPHV